jgi:DNA-directed RNA polymerase specialized sigma24 family protein
MSNEQFDELVAKLDTLTKLFAANLLKDAKNQTAKIETLSSLNITNKEITRLIGCSESTVRKAKSRAKNQHLAKGGKQSA